IPHSKILFIIWSETSSCLNHLILLLLKIVVRMPSWFVDHPQPILALLSYKNYVPSILTTYLNLV
ncbi:MAG: hypothetical protein QXO85_05450, partial [Sulfolobales archaeon]